MPVLNPEIALVARRHHGVLSLAQAIDAGASSHQLRRAVERGELQRPHPGVFRIAGAPYSWHQSLRIAVLAGGPTALASHRSAAALWELDGSTKGRKEIVGARHRRARYELAKCHESTDLHLADPTERDRIPCTGLERTLLDLGAVVPRERLQQAVDDAIRRNLCTWDDLLRTLAVHSRRGRRGVGPLRAVLEISSGEQVPDSHFNRLVERLLLANELPAPVVEHNVLSAAGLLIARVDLAYPRLKIAIELDGRRDHFTSVAFERDRARQNALELEGWIVLRYTWRQFVDTPLRLVAEVHAALQGRAS